MFAKSLDLRCLRITWEGENICQSVRVGFSLGAFNGVDRVLLHRQRAYCLLSFAPLTGNVLEDLLRGDEAGRSSRACRAH